MHVRRPGTVQRFLPPPPSSPLGAGGLVTAAQMIGAWRPG